MHRRVHLVLPTEVALARSRTRVRVDQQADNNTLWAVLITLQLTGGKYSISRHSLAERFLLIKSYLEEMTSTLPAASVTLFLLV